MALQDKLDAFKADFEAGRFPLKPTKEALDTMQRATAELIASGQAQRAKKAGDAAPEFVLEGSRRQAGRSRDLLAKGPLVVSFYRGVWCPYCNLELQALQEALPEIAARGASLVAISPQTAPNSRKSERENKLSFPILSDVASEARRRLRHPLRAAGRSRRALQVLQERPADVQRQSGLGAADARALRHRPRRHHRLCGGEPGLHATPRSVRAVAGARPVAGRQGGLIVTASPLRVRTARGAVSSFQVELATCTGENAGRST